jgi:NAD(P)-dependent dehydrogenase (short-subunit alcohol dehydrogenase family)
MTRTYAVTGVASGIGAELARILTEEGHRVIGFDIQPTDTNVDRFIPLDLSSDDAIAEAVSQVDVPLDGLCNNAGLPPRERLEVPVVQVNFLGTRAFTQAMLPHLAAGASVVNMASRAGHGWRDNLDQVLRLGQVDGLAGAADFVASEGIDATRCYNLTKEAVLLWTAAMSEELAQRDLRVNSLSPAAVSTGILDDFKQAFGDKVTKNLARAGRAGRPEEIAAVAAFVLSPDSHWIKGTDIPIDGGMGAYTMSDALGLDAMK